MRVSKLTCDDCGLSHEGEFSTPRLFLLDQADQRFIELFVLASGSLKKMAELLNVSYPTVRNRLDGVIERLEQEKHRDEARKAQILDDIEKGRISAKRGMRLLEIL